MRQIIYRSTTTAPTGRAADDIPAILREAAARNGIDGITGLLYSEEAAFLQAIEGPEESIAHLIDSLRADPRHRDFTILLDRATDRRDFGDWTMAYRDRRESIDMFDERMRVLLAGVSAETVRYFRALAPAGG